MKLLNTRILQILKLVLLYSLVFGGAYASTLVSSDRFLLRILDRAVSLQDFNYQLRNLRALDCVYPDSLIMLYLGKKFVSDLDKFVSKFPTEDLVVRPYMHQNAEFLKQSRFLFKILRYAEDQRTQISTDIEKLIRESVKENHCDSNILSKDNLKQNFQNIIQTEVYFRMRYGAQLKSAKKDMQSVRSSIELFVESLDKQFIHEYYW